MRLDKYLKVSRLIKRRTVANEACDAGRVQVNGRVVKAGYEVKTGDVIAIAMGPAGVITRIGGACMGSCLTFGTAGEASAPGQLDAKKLRTVLEIVQEAIG